MYSLTWFSFFFFQAEDGIRDLTVTGVQTCALPICPIRYTIGSGCSGGSIYQQQAANDYPGIFDGILPACSFPDSWSTAIEVVDCRLRSEERRVGKECRSRGSPDH